MMDSDFCVIGNGLLGAAIALELSQESNQVLLIGAKYGAEGQFYSAHEDDSRMVRQFHQDIYWEKLTARNMKKLFDLMKTTQLPIFHKTPVLYRFPAQAPSSSNLLKTPFASHHAFTFEDLNGGFLNPKIYIQALNQAAKKNGAKIQQGIVQHIEKQPHGFKLRTRDTIIQTTYVVDARGFYSPDCSVVGKIAIFTESPKKTAIHPYCFIDANIHSTTIRDVYGFYHYLQHHNKLISKFGFSESNPIRLQHAADISHWFHGGYQQHPLLSEANDWIRNFLNDDSTEITDIKPCAFTITNDGRPNITFEDGLLTLSGCNGMAAKCCQALAEDGVSFFKERQ